MVMMQRRRIHESTVTKVPGPKAAVVGHVDVNVTVGSSDAKRNIQSHSGDVDAFEGIPRGDGVEIAGRVGLGEQFTDEHLVACFAARTSRLPADFGAVGFPAQATVLVQYRPATAAKVEIPGAGVKMRSIACTLGDRRSNGPSSFFAQSDVERVDSDRPQSDLTERHYGFAG